MRVSIVNARLYENFGTVGLQLDASKLGEL